MYSFWNLNHNNDKNLMAMLEMAEKGMEHIAQEKLDANLEEELEDIHGHLLRACLPMRAKPEPL